MRGIYTAGVLDFFLEKGISFDAIYAVSAGACHALSFLSNQKGRAKRVWVDNVDNKYFGTFYSLIKTGDYFGADFNYNIVPNRLDKYDYEAFKKNKTKFYPVITNLKTGKAVYYLIDDIKNQMDVVRASASLPMISKKVKIDNDFYLDGGLSDPIPLEKAIEDGYLKNVVVLTRHESYVKKPNSSYKFFWLRYFKYPCLMKTLLNRHEVYNSEARFARNAQKDGRSFVISPSKPIDIPPNKKTKENLCDVYDLGYNDAKKNYEKLIEYLN